MNFFETFPECSLPSTVSQNAIKMVGHRSRWATLKAGMTERRNDGMAESRNGGKLPQILKDGIAESRNDGKYLQILKDGMTENHPKS